MTKVLTIGPITISKDGPAYNLEANDCQWSRPSLVQALESIGAEWKTLPATAHDPEVAKEFVALGGTLQVPEQPKKEATKPKAEPALAPAAK